MNVEESKFSDGTELVAMIGDINISEVVLEHLKDLNLAKSTSKNKMMPRTNVFSVSQSSYRCYRKLFYDMTQPILADESKLGTFTMGDMVDLIMKGALKKAGAKVDVGCGKSYFDDKIRIQGMNDAEFSDCVIEVKSVSPFAWKYIVGGKDKFGNAIIGSPKIQHVRQLNTYMELRNIDSGVLVYVNKDNFTIKTFSIEFDESMMVQTIGRCVIVWQHIIENKGLPQRTKGDECGYCGHKGVCR